MKDKKIMVVGFMFNELLDTVILIKKDHPDWQAGMLNGIGGHVKDGENAWEAMVREFREETGINTVRADWLKFASMNGADFEVYCFCGHGEHIPVKQEGESEEPNRYHLSSLITLDQIENLVWLLPLAVDCMDDGRPSHVLITYPPRD